MNYREDQKSGRKLSILGYGCMRFPRKGAAIDYAKTEKLIVDAVAAGVNYFDTAYIYGGSEETLGKIVNANKLRDKIYIASKLPLGKIKVYEDFETLFQTTLSRLQTDYIDYYLMHNLSDTAKWKRLCELGIEKWIAEKKASGQIRSIGFSFHGSQGEFMSLLDMYAWEFCQIQYNYVNINYQAGQAGLLKAAEKGLPVIVMEPLLGGKLANGLPDSAKKILQQKGGYTPVQWAFRWLWNQPEVTVVLSGMNDDAQLADNTKTASNATPGMFTQEETNVFPAVEAAFRESYKIPCTGCNYCMPCPQNINIPGSFAAYNMSYAVGLVSGLMMYITAASAANLQKGYSLRNCVKCGKCEKACPQHIQIIKEGEAVTKRLEPWWVRAAMKVASKVMS